MDTVQITNHGDTKSGLQAYKTNPEIHELVDKLRQESQTRKHGLILVKEIREGSVPLMASALPLAKHSSPKAILAMIDDEVILGTYTLNLTRQPIPKQEASQALTKNTDARPT